MFSTCTSDVISSSIVEYLRFQLPFLVRLLLDKTPVSGTADSKQTLRGSLFYTLYNKTINSYLATVAKQLVASVVAKAKDDVSFVGSLLIGLADHVSKERTLRKK